jgi:hypothetical protein
MSPFPVQTLRCPNYHLSPLVNRPQHCWPSYRRPLYAPWLLHTFKFSWGDVQSTKRVRPISKGQVRFRFLKGCDTTREGCDLAGREELYLHDVDISYLASSTWLTEKFVDYFLVSTNGENLPLIPSCRPWVIAMQYTLKTPDDGPLVQAETETEHLLAIQPRFGCLTHPAHG